MNPIEWTQYEVFGNSLFVWGLGTFVFLAVWAGLSVVRRILASRLGSLSKSRDVVALDVAVRVVRSTKAWFGFLLALFVGTRFIDLPAGADAALIKGAIIVFVLQAGIWASSAAVGLIQAKREDDLTDNRSAVAAMDILAFVARVAIWAFALLLILDNLGVDITALVAGLGVGGIAVALAAQNILSDLFASLSIVLDKPFVVGDFLIVGEHLGSVERVGIKTTRLRSLSGEQLVFSNNDLLASRIRNYGRMFERRVVFSIGVTYQTGAEHLRRIPTMIREIIEAEDNVRFDRAHFQKYGDFALVFEIVYYVLTSDYTQYMDVQQSINLKIYEQFETAGIEFAYPTQTLYMQRAS